MCDLFRDRSGSSWRAVGFLVGSSLRGLRIVGAGLVAAPLLITPAHAGGFDQFPMPSVDDQKKVGKQAADDVLKQYKVVNDSRSRELQAVGSKLVAALGRTR